MSPVEVIIKDFDKFVVDDGVKNLPGGVEVHVNKGANVLHIPNILFFRANDCLMMVRKNDLVSNRVLLQEGCISWVFMDKEVRVRVLEK